MTDVKVSLTIILPGRQMVSKEESLKSLNKVVTNSKGKAIKKNGKLMTEEQLVPDFKKNTLTTLKVKDGKEFKTLKVYTRKCVPAKQVINLTEEAYKHMTSNFIPSEYKGIWSSLSPNQRLKWHCEQIAQLLGGVVDSFQILD